MKLKIKLFLEIIFADLKSITLGGGLHNKYIADILFITKTNITVNKEGHICLDDGTMHFVCDYLGSFLGLLAKIILSLKARKHIRKYEKEFLAEKIKQLYK